MTLDQFSKIIDIISTPLTLLLIGAIGWAVRNWLEKKYEQESYWRALEEKLRDDRIQIYNDILDPFIIMLTKDDGIQKYREYRGKTAMEVGLEQALSLDYRRTGFKLSLMGSDEVVRAYNNLMQYIYTEAGPHAKPDFTKAMLTRLGDLLLEIRRSVGNERTTLSRLEMLEWLITDIKKYI